MDDSTGLLNIGIRMDDMVALLKAAPDSVLQSILADEGSWGELFLHNVKRILKERHMDFNRIRVVTNLFKNGNQIGHGEEWFDMPIGGTPTDSVAQMLKFQGDCDEMLGGLLGTKLTPILTASKCIHCGTISPGFFCPGCGLEAVPEEEPKKGRLIVKCPACNGLGTLGCSCTTKNPGPGKVYIDDLGHYCQKCGHGLKDSDAKCPGCGRDCTRDEKDGSS